MLVTLSLTYAICIIPAMGTSWGLWDVEKQPILQNLFTCIYWCMYGEQSNLSSILSKSLLFTGVNFVLYIAISKRMRNMYTRFLSDMLNQGNNKKMTKERILTTLSSSSASRAVALKKNLTEFPVNSEHSVLYCSNLHSSSIKHNCFQVSMSIISSDNSINWKIYQK